MKRDYTRAVLLMIKKLATVLIGLTLFFSPIFAQKTRFGLSLGLGTAIFTGPPGLIYEKEAFFTYCGGIWLDHALGEHFSIQSGLTYSKKGFDGSLSSFGLLTVITPVRLRIQYLEIPLVLKYYLTRKLYIGAGPYFAQKISGQLTLFREENDRLEPHEIGYTLGSGIVINLFRKNHSLELQWRRGVTPVFSIGDDKYIFTTLTILYGLYF